MKIYLDEGYHYGIGAFETILLIQQKPVFLEEHLDRIRKSLEYFKIDQEIETEKILQFLEKQEPKERSVLKISASPDNLFFSVRDYPYTADQFKKGFSLWESSVLRNETSPFTYHKTLNYGDNILEKRKAAENNVDEPYFLNTKSMITEGATTNLFFIKKGKLYTPGTESGLLNGILRQWILKQYEVSEINIPRGSIAGYDEIFATNSLIGIMPVYSINGIPLSSMDKSYKLHKEYELYLESHYCRNE